MPDLENLAKIVGAIATIVAASMALIYWLRPIKITPSTLVVFDGSRPDQIIAVVVNRSGKPIYITDCISRGTYPKRYTLWRHFRQPLMPLRLYPVVRFGGPSHRLLHGEPVRVEPQQPIELRHSLSEHPLAKFRTSTFLVEVTLSNGRKFRSSREDVPGRWRLKLPPNS